MSEDKFASYLEDEMLKLELDYPDYPDYTDDLDYDSEYFDQFDTFLNQTSGTEKDWLDLGRGTHPLRPY